MNLYSAAILAWLAWDGSSFFDWLARRPWYRQHLTDWAALLPVAAGELGLEIGCGPGLLTQAMAERGVQMTGLDKSAKMVARARRNAAECTFVRGDAFALPMANDSQALAFAASVINVVPEPEKLVQEMARVVRPGGHVAVLFPTPRLGVDAAKIAQNQAISGMSRAALLFWGGKAKKLEAAAVAAMVEAAGLRDVEVDYVLEGTVASVTGRVS